MSRTTPDQIIAHVELLRAVDRLLAQAQIVREKRDTLDRLLAESGPPDSKDASTATARKGSAHAP
jgi:hypothetical protein